MPDRKLARRTTGFGRPSDAGIPVVEEAVGSRPAIPPQRGIP